jgi:hypothetical protein
MSKVTRALATGAAAAAMSAGAVVAMAGPATAHVHGFTPLGCLTTDAAQSGAAVGFERQQAPEGTPPFTGGPIIPENASGTRPSGGQGAENACTSHP